MIEVAVLQFGQQPAALAAVRSCLTIEGFSEVATEVIPPEEAAVRRALRIWADNRGIELVLTIGGVGLGPRERVPEAMGELELRCLPGVAEAIRAAGLSEDPLAALWRNRAGIRARTVVVNLPADGAATGLTAVLPSLREAVRQLRMSPA
jgi:molybdopterin adenylyltransferase